MAKIQDLGFLERPREKAERFGIDKLTDSELLALIINVGTIGHSSLDIAREMMREAKSLNTLIGKPYEYYLSFKGINKVNALKLTAVFEILKRINEKQQLIYEENNAVTSESLFRRYSLSLTGLAQENFILVILSKNKQIIFETTLYKGDDVCAVVSSREIIRLLSIHNGYYFYLIHNHPNGSLEPSKSDIDFTNSITEKAEKIGVKLLDHIIITDKDYYSFLQASLTKEWN
ncbi:MAG: RadC family protein [Bacilli bacterium]|nr:RadC family protein [Bacilli bacterium]